MHATVAMCAPLHTLYATTGMLSLNLNQTGALCTQKEGGFFNILLHTTVLFLTDLVTLATTQAVLVACLVLTPSHFLHS